MEVQDDSAVLPVAPDWEDWLHRVFVQPGPVGWEDLDIMAMLARFEVATIACERVVRDVQALNGRSSSVSVVDDGGIAQVMFEGRLANGVGMHSVGVDRLTVEIACAVQEEVMEDMWRVWPQCGQHRLGLHPQIVDGAAVRWCRSGGHFKDRIGELCKSGS